MDIASLIQSYGYLAVFVGCMLEGETVLVLAGAAAHLGYLSLPIVAGVAGVGAFLGDLAWFIVGRHYGPALLQRWPALAHGEALLHERLATHATSVVVLMRFAVGLRTAIPVALGGSTAMPLARFALLNAVGAVLWTLVFSTAGYVFGAAVNALYDRARHDGEILLAVALAAGVVFLGVRHFLRRRRSLSPRA